jgi:hypothetical protein
MELFDLRGAREVLHKLDINVTRKLLVDTLLALNNEEPKPIGKCMYGILPIELTKVGELHFFLVIY